MRLIISLLITLLFVFTACKNEVEKPQALIPREQMKEILKEMYVHKNLVQLSYANRLAYNQEEVTSGILKKHHISIQDFEASYQYYTVNHASFDELLKEIKGELSQSKYAPKQDSLVPAK